MIITALVLSLSLSSPTGVYSLEIDDEAQKARITQHGKTHELRLAVSGTFVTHSDTYFALIEQLPERGYTGTVYFFDAANLSKAPTPITTAPLKGIVVGKNLGSFLITGKQDGKVMGAIRFDENRKTSEWNFQRPAGTVEWISYPISTSGAVVITTEGSEPGSDFGEVAVRLLSPRGASERKVLVDGWSIRNSYGTGENGVDSVMVNLGKRGQHVVSASSFDAKFEAPIPATYSPQRFDSERAVSNAVDVARKLGISEEEIDTQLGSSGLGDERDDSNKWVLFAVVAAIVLSLAAFFLRKRK